MRRLILIFLGTAFCIPLYSSAAPLKACLKTESGKVVIKRRCKSAKGQQEINAEILQGLGATQVGPAGPPGPVGQPGPVGPGFEDLETVENIQTFGFIDPFISVGPIAVTCPSGKNILTYQCAILDNGGMPLTVSSSSGSSADARTVSCTFRNSGFAQALNPMIGARARCGSIP